MLYKHRGEIIRGTTLIHPNIKDILLDVNESIRFILRTNNYRSDKKLRDHIQ